MNDLTKSNDADEFERDGGQAFPLGFIDEDEESPTAGEQIIFLGMSMRDYFASKAMCGVLIANPEMGNALGSDKRISEIAYHLADAMIAERNKK